MGPEWIGLFVPLGIMATIVTIVVGKPAVNAWAKKIETESKRPAVPGEVMSRLERMEQSIDAIAVEIERISEGQRFTTKLLAERNDAPALPSPRASETSRQ
ncbi:MAG TPA: hypothetical protein VF042_02225 [Gemmatimonadaceae bacterium]